MNKKDLIAAIEAGDEEYVETVIDAIAKAEAKKNELAARKAAYHQQYDGIKKRNAEQVARDQAKRG